MWLPPFPSKDNEWFHITIALLGVTRHRKRREQRLFLGLSLVGSCRAWPSRRSKKGFPLARRIWGVWELHSPLHQPSGNALKWPREGFLCAPVTTGSFATLWWVRGNYKDLNLLGLQQLWRNITGWEKPLRTVVSREASGKCRDDIGPGAEIQSVKLLVLHTLIQSQGKCCGLWEGAWR